MSELSKLSGITLMCIEKMNKAQKWEAGAEKLREQVGKLIIQIPKNEMESYIKFTSPLN